MKKLLVYICLSLLCFAQTKTSDEFYIKANGVSIKLRGINLDQITIEELCTVIANKTDLDKENIGIAHEGRIYNSNNRTLFKDTSINESTHSPMVIFTNSYKETASQILQQYYDRTHPKQNTITNAPQEKPEHYFAMGMLFMHYIKSTLRGNDTLD